MWVRISFGTRGLRTDFRSFADLDFDDYGQKRGSVSRYPQQMEQVLGNLVSAALRYTSECGAIRLTATKDKANLILGVQDNGSGITPEILLSIFERCYRSDPSVSTY